MLGFLLEEKGFTRTRPYGDKPRLLKRDAPGEDTNREQGHLSSHPIERHLGEAPGNVRDKLQ
jgi:hypothetical protein